MKTCFYIEERAFTLVELLMVMAIIGALALMSIPLLTQYVNKTKSSRSAADIRAIEKSIIAYILEKDSLPATLNDIGINQLDPWQRPYQYSAIESSPAPLVNFLGIELNTDFDLYSQGADGIESSVETSDDVVRSNNGSFVGARAGL